MNNSLELTQIGRYDSGIFDEGAAEITAYDADSQDLWVINSANSTIDILALREPTQPTFTSAISIEEFGGGINSIAINNGIVAAAIEGESAQAPGSIVFFDTGGNVLNQVTVGALPDMVTFTPDGTKVLVANEGEPDEDDPSNNPEGSISIIDISGGVESAAVTTADFTAFNGQEAELRGRGVRIFPGETFANDAEPEFITVSPDSTQAFVSLQENNAIALVDLETGEVSEIQPLGLKDYSRGLPSLTNYPWDLSNEVLGTTPTGQEILLGGMSGLYYEGKTEDGLLQFIATPDRGPNGEPTDVDGDGENERPFPLPDYQPRLIRFTLDRESGEFNLTEEIFLTREEGETPLTGLPNLQAGDAGSAYTDEVPVDLNGEPLENDPFGADLESVLVAPDGTFWLADEYRPAIYHFDANGVLIDRFIPQGTAASVGESAGTFGTETLPAVYAQRRSNRGFEGMALNTDNGNLYAFIQSPIDNPDVSNIEAEALDEANDFNSRNSQVLRILEVDPATGEAVGEYVYFLEGSPGVDKIGDAVYAGDGKIYVIERDSGTGSDAEKFIFEVDLTNATNILDTDLSTATGETTALESMTADDLAAMDIQPVTKTQVLNLPSLGYTAGDKPEGLALLDDGSLAVINDNDFGLLDEEIPVDGSVPFNPDPIQTVLGIIEFNGSNGLDASDTDGINIDNEPVYGLYQPDAIAAYEVDGEVYYVTANEGDARDEDERVEDLELDAKAFPNASELQAEDELGRLEVSAIDGDIDGDGDYDRLVSYGGRSFSIRDANGNLVFDSGDDFAQITAAQVPELFNSNGTIDSFDSRSDAKGAEPEGVVIGEIDDKYYAFVGLERTGGIMVYDISDPAEAEFIQYINPIDAETGDALDLAPEGLEFISAEDSPNGEPLLTVSNEVSGTVTVYQIDLADTEATDSEQLEFLGEVVFPTGTIFEDTEVGGILALTYDAENSTYYALADDRSTINDARYYDVSIDLSDGSLDEGDVQFSELSDATDISDIDSLTETDVTLLSKELLLDFDDLGIELDNSEAVAFGETLADGRQSLIVASDNNFNDSQKTQFLAFAIGEPAQDRDNNSHTIQSTIEADEIEITGSNKLVSGNAGDDAFFVTTGSDNSINGNLGADQFWIANGEIPASPNTIEDFLM